MNVGTTMVERAWRLEDVGQRWLQMPKTVDLGRMMIGSSLIISTILALNSQIKGFECVSI